MGFIVLRWFNIRSLGFVSRMVSCCEGIYTLLSKSFRIWIEFKTMQWVWSSYLLLRGGGQSFVCRWLSLYLRGSACKALGLLWHISCRISRFFFEPEIYWVLHFLEVGVIVLGNVICSPFILVIVYVGFVSQLWRQQFLWKRSTVYLVSKF